jgi:hypothetical protein
MQSRARGWLVLVGSSQRHTGVEYMWEEKKKEKCPAGMLDPMLSAYGEILSGSNNTNICNNNHNFFFFFFI